jgi:hypothetical protein
MLLQGSWLIGDYIDRQKPLVDGDAAQEATTPVDALDAVRSEASPP